MNTFIIDNYTVEGFWKNWHCTLNFWLLRYLYFPLGGSKCNLFLQIRNVFLVFSFVAMTHSLEINMLTWLIVTVIGFVLEIVFRAKISNHPKVKGLFLYKYICAFFGGIEMVLQLIFNIWCYGVGTTKFIFIFKEYMNWQGFLYFLFLIIIVLGICSFLLLALLHVPNVMVIFDFKR